MITHVGAMKQTPQTQQTRQSTLAQQSQHHALYNTRRWQRIARMQLASHPLCTFCLARGLVVPATVADHVEPHHGDRSKFWLGTLQSLCATCHSRDKRLSA
jgi:5-methylcytosine-specific restriction protein A